jgi:Fic family protein
MSGFHHFDLKIVSPPFESPLTNLIIDLDFLRRKRLRGTTPPLIFVQLKRIFHMLESLASARIEGNITTVAEYVETKIGAKPIGDSSINEIQNMENCLEYIHEHIGDSKIDRRFISEVHQMVVKDLPTTLLGEGDRTPGSYRSTNVTIQNSAHTPPDPSSVASYMDELFEFIAKLDEPKYDLLKIAIAHHRFVWIHPFSNGNGRTVRLLTYALLVKYGFIVDNVRILNPTAIFCNNRKNYYDNLSLADSGEDANILTWCYFVLSGLKIEIEKIDRLIEYSFLKSNVLIPAIDDAFARKFITDVEFRILKVVIEKGHIKASDLIEIIPSKHESERSRVIRMLRDKNMLVPLENSPRKYTIFFYNNYLLRGVIKALQDQGFVSFS